MVSVQRARPTDTRFRKGNGVVRATLSSFVVWKDGVIRSTAAVGGKYITMLVAWLMAKPELIP
eukprot:433717-Rhodomonas_salina.1